MNDHLHEPIQWQLKKSGVPFTTIAETVESEHDLSTPRIRCPICAWQPHSSSSWLCWSGPGPEPPFEACGTTWNTFETGGRCPGCSHQWQWTTCLRCGEWSRHVDWYEEPEARA